MEKQPLFLFYKGTSIISRAVRIIGNTKYSHCCILDPDRKHSYELTWTSPFVIKHFKYKKGNFDLFAFYRKLTEEEWETIFRFIFENIDSGYDWRFVLSRGLNIVFGVPVLNAKHKYSCDEAIVYAFKKINVDLLNDTNVITPEKLSKSKYLVKSNEKIEM